MTTGNRPVSIALLEDQVPRGSDVRGIIRLSYEFRFDTVVINSQVEDSNDTFEYVELNGKKINYPYARMPILEKEISGLKELVFVARTNHVPTNPFSKGKFRVSIIQEHKEIASDTAYIKLEA
jgi:hypothetical protein